MKFYLAFLLLIGGALGAEDVDEEDEDSEELTVESPDFVVSPEMCYPYPCYPYETDVDELWFWENEAMYPTRKEDSWVEDLSRPW